MIPTILKYRGEVVSKGQLKSKLSDKEIEEFKLLFSRNGLEFDEIVYDDV